MATTALAPSVLSIFARLLVLWSFLILRFNCCCDAQNLGERKMHVVYLDPSVKSSEALALKLLGEVLEGGKPGDSLMYTYKTINGFAARLSKSEAEKLDRLKEVTGVSDDEAYLPIDGEPTFAPGYN